MFGFYIRHNIGIAFQCFAGGLFAGIGSLFYLIYNGAIIGAVAGYLTERGHGPTFWAFVVTHSAFELTAIVLSGAAGLKIGYSLVAPGRLTRVQSLVAATRELRTHCGGRGRHAARCGRARGILVIGILAAPLHQIRRGGRMLDRRSQLPHFPGPKCKLIHSHCA